MSIKENNKVAKMETIKNFLLESIGFKEATPV
jgi:hypothetical protein